jgi:hypothetical protein
VCRPDHNHVTTAVAVEYRVPSSSLRALARRQGVIFGLGVDELDRNARDLHALRQARIVGNQLV